MKRRSSRHDIRASRRSTSSCSRYVHEARTHYSPSGPLHDPMDSSIKLAGRVQSICLQVFNCFQGACQVDTLSPPLLA
jgi:hypothetical protein